MSSSSSSCPGRQQQQRRRPPSLLLFVVVLWLVVAQDGVVVVLVECASSVADSYPVMVEAGEDNFLILNDDEVANAEILQKLSGASKEEVEEIVDSNPQVQEMILGRIKSAVDKRKTTVKGGGKAAPVLIPDVNKPQQKLVYGKMADKPYKKPTKIGFVGKGGDEEEAEEDEDDEEVDEQQIAAWRKGLQEKKAKLFKIGSKLKAKLMKMAKKKEHKKKKKKPKQQQQQQPHSWPHFHYSVSSS